jgi:hypothetical protein
MEKDEEKKIWGFIYLFSIDGIRILESHYDILKNIKSFLNKREIFWIEKLNTFDPKQEKGWNLNKGGGTQLGYKHREESKNKIKINSPNHCGEKNPMFGKRGKDSPSWGRKRLDLSKRNKEQPKRKSAILFSSDGKKYQICNIKLFCEKYKLNPINIRRVLQGKRNHHKGWIGKYVQ